MFLTDEELKRLQDSLKRMPNIDVCNYFENDTEINALLACLERDEFLLDRAIGLMKVINGPESKCVYGGSRIACCRNHTWIREAEAWRGESKGE